MTRISISSQRRSWICFSCSALASIACRLMELFETPTVDAICGSTSWYSRVETPRSRRTEHLGVRSRVVPQRFISRDLHFPFGLVTKARSLDSHLTVGHFDASRL